MNHQSLISGEKDIPLSADIVRKNIGWNARAQQYLIFSETWFKYRAMSYILPVILLSLFLWLTTLSLNNASSQWKAAVFYTGLSIVINLFLGRGLAVLVCRTKWSQKKVAFGVIFSITLSFAICSSMYFYVKNLEQQSITEIKNKAANGPIDEFEKVELSIKKNTYVYAAMLVFHFIFYAWMAGFLDLWAYFQQQNAIKDALTEQQLEKYKIERNEAEMRLSLLASQIEPHFLFNTLSGVRSAILSDPQKGVAIIDHLAAYLRFTIPEIRNDGSCTQVKISSQFNAIRAYLEVIRHRIPRLSFNTHYDNDLSEYLIPPLMLISLVENAVKHGIELKKGPVHIDVLAHRIIHDGKEYLQLSVSDNGLGFSDTNSGSGIGLSNIRERLRQLYSNDATLQLICNEEGGVVATIRLPLSPIPLNKSSILFS